VFQVVLPPGEDLSEWLAVNTVDFYNAVNLLYNTLTEFCTPSTCPTMSAGPKYEYRWADGVKVKKPIECSAPEYVEYLMEWVESQLDDESVRANTVLCPLCSTRCTTTNTLCSHSSCVLCLLLHCATPVQIFPQRLGTPFPRNFVDNVRTICKRLYRVYVCRSPSPLPSTQLNARQYASRGLRQADC
jgi:MOB kinase activator 1